MYASILRVRDVGMVEENQWGAEGRATLDRFREDVHDGNVAVIAYEKKLMLLVRFVKFGRNHKVFNDGHSCSICYRFLHFGATQDRRRCLLRIYEKRADALAKSKIAASKSQFVSRTLGLED